MDALANYDSDDDNHEKFDTYKDNAGKSLIAGDNYDNVQMDLSEENSSSSSKGGSRSESRDFKEDSNKCSTYRGGASVKERGSDSRRADRDRRVEHRDRKRSRSPDRGHHSSRHHASRREDKHRTDESSSRRSYESSRSYKSSYSPPKRRSRERSRSPRASKESRRRSRSRDRHRRNRRSRSPAVPSAARSSKSESTSSPGGESGGAGDKDGSTSPPSLTSEQYLASLSLAQKLAQQVQPQRNLGSLGLGGATNPTLTRIQEQLQRRRMLWQQNKVNEPKEVAGPSNNNWEGALIPKDQDGTQTAKFKRLMGMKGVGPDTDAAPPEAAPSSSQASSAQEQLKRNDEMFNDMERQYEVARLATHTHRGLGLGFGTFQCNYPR